MKPTDTHCALLHLATLQSSLVDAHVYTPARAHHIRRLALIIESQPDGSCDPLARSILDRSYNYETR